MTDEIGSEFWRSDTPLEGNGWVCPWAGDVRYFLSGRTALYALLEDVVQRGTMRRAYLPSYCCHTMIEPFVRLGFSVDFYPVVYNGQRLCAEIDSAHACDVILVMDYFGFTCHRPEYPSGALVIRDMTHRAFAPAGETADADYFFASLRKWGAVAGAAVAGKAQVKFGDSISQRPCNTEYIRQRDDGYALKASYMADGGGEKSLFLSTFAQAEDMLERDYTGYEADAVSLVAAQATLCDASARCRRRNADILLTGLAQSQLVYPLFSRLGSEDVPLFVPVMVRDGRRDALRDFLIRQSIYCPVHWPLSTLHRLTDDTRKIYDGELSLVCDQRYGAEDMQHICDAIAAFQETTARQ